jgi:Raf kinase inhibitor-like YbhB/YbcL family protein
MTFTLSSPAFADGQPIPRRYTQDGENLSPPLGWYDVPPQTRSFLLVLEDPDAPRGTFRHWGLYNLARDRGELPEGVGHGVAFAGEPVEDIGTATNDFGHPAYDGPAPPRGDKPHHYVFRLMALDLEPLSHSPGLTVAEAMDAAQEHVIGEARLAGTYRR